MKYLTFENIASAIVIIVFIITIFLKRGYRNGIRILFADITKAQLERLSGVSVSDLVHEKSVLVYFNSGADRSTVGEVKLCFFRGKVLYGFIPASPGLLKLGTLPPKLLSNLKTQSEIWQNDLVNLLTQVEMLLYSGGLNYRLSLHTRKAEPKVDITDTDLKDAVGL
ncbi:MAG TPA: hypothetical protein VEA59_02455 [Patescibacteria group bacterium]|nr:hypothetical protein [Patescibacteria group bacterium]